jgi:hypothetical protein
MICLLSLCLEFLISIHSSKFRLCIRSPGQWTIDLAHTTRQFNRKGDNLTYILSRGVDLVIVIRKRDFRNIIRSGLGLNSASNKGIAT